MPPQTQAGEAASRVASVRSPWSYTQLIALQSQKGPQAAHWRKLETGALQTGLSSPPPTDKAMRQRYASDQRCSQWLFTPTKHAQQGSRCRPLALAALATAMALSPSGSLLPERMQSMSRLDACWSNQEAVSR